MLYGEHAKSQAEAEYPELWRGLVGAWSPCLSPRGGTVLRDLSGRGNHGTLTNMDPETDWVTRGGKQALDFDGSNDYVNLERRVLDDVASACTINAWVATTAAASVYRTVFTQVGPGTNTSNTMYLYNGTVCFHHFPPGGGNLETTATLNDGLLHMATVGFRAGRRAAAIDGNVKSADATPETYSGVASTAWTIGATSAGTLFRYLGQIHEVLVWDSFNEALWPLLYRLGPGGWATPRRRRWNYVTAQTAIPYWVFARKNARLIGGGVS